MNDLVSRAFETLQALLIASILGTILIGASSVFASDDSPFGFDESGKLYHRDTLSPMSPNSRRTTEEDRRQYNAWSNEQTRRTNEALLDKYYSPKPSGPPSSPGDYWVTGPDGQSQWCRSIAPRQFICQ